MKLPNTSQREGTNTYRKISTLRAVVVGVCLLIVHRVFKGTVPSLKAYAESNGISEDTIRRAARVLLFPVMRLLRARRPGPRRSISSGQAGQSQALAACQAALAILKALLPGPVANLLATPAKRGIAVQHALHFEKLGVPLVDTAHSLGDRRENAPSVDQEVAAEWRWTPGPA